MNPYLYEALKGAVIGFFLVLLVLVLFGCSSQPSQPKQSEFEQLTYFCGCAANSISKVDRVICRYFVGATLKEAK
jgi:hypothetical protein